MLAYVGIDPRKEVRWLVQDDQIDIALQQRQAAPMTIARN
jgi:hypothetical protein